MTKLERQKEWDTRITKYQTSGLSVQEWCAANNVKSHWYWLRKHKSVLRQLSICVYLKVWRG